jgi:hypothetical protein
MFWSYSNPNKIVELKKKNLFIAEFIGTQNFNWQGAGATESSIKFLVKKIDGPSLNLNVERSHANQHVHYFHTGEVNWEPINATFVTATDSESYEDVPPDNPTKDPTKIANWKSMFFNHLNQNLIASTNRTGMIDFPVFCDYIKITEINSYKTLTEPKKTNFYIFKPRITKIAFGSYDYGSDEANEVNVTFVPEWCDYAEDYVQEEIKRQEKRNP